MEWLRHAPLDAPRRPSRGARRAPVLRLKHLLGVIERNAEHRERVGAMLGVVPARGRQRRAARRLRLRAARGPLGRVRPARARPHPAADAGDERSRRALRPALSARHRCRLADAPRRRDARAPRQTLAPLADDGSDWREPFLEAIMFLASAVRAAGFSPLLRQRMSPELLVDQPFRQLAHVAERFASTPSRASLEDSCARCFRKRSTCARCSTSAGAARRACTSTSRRTASRSTSSSRSTSCERTHRIDQLLGCVLSDEPGPRPVALRRRARRHGRGAALDPQPLLAPLLAARAQGRRAQRRNRRALHHPRPRRIPRDAARRARRRRGARPHDAAQVLDRRARPRRVLGRPRRRR